MKVLKFGGTSMANADSIKKVADIIVADKSARFIVVSAPGKREKADTKVTDLLYACYEKKLETGFCNEAMKAVEKRFDDIVTGLGLDLNLQPYFNDIIEEINSGAGKDFVASRGEYLSAIVMAKLLGFTFIDASEIIRFNLDGEFNSELTNEVCNRRLGSCACAVIPGFYGCLPNKKIKTFSRGGSDVSGAIIARAVNATVYENWTDVDGFMTCDPRIVDNPSIIEMITYKELRELSYMGANVLHPDSIFPVRKCDIPINIRNTFNPSAKGTMIVPTKKLHSGEYKRAVTSTITGIAGKTDFVSIFVEKSMMNNELGFARKILSILERYGVQIEHMPSGIDTLSVIIDKSEISGDTLNHVLSDIKTELKADSVEYTDGLALLAVVGHGMSQKKGTAYRVCKALSDNGINIRMIDQGSTELNIIVAIDAENYEKGVKAIYSEFKNN